MTPIASDALYSQTCSFDAIFKEIRSGLTQRFSPEISSRRPVFDHSANNRMRIRLDRITGSHYEICFRRNYSEFALHFESTPLISRNRCQEFIPYLQEITNQVGQNIKSGPLENQGWMRVWYELKREPINQERVALYVDQYSRFIAATFPILSNVYSNSIIG